MIKVDGVVITPTMFPDGTSQVWKLSEEVLNGTAIEWTFEHEGEIMHVMQLADLMNKPPRLDCPFLPYGRQDKPVSNTSTFALSSFMKIVNSMRIHMFTTVDAHSNEVRKYLRPEIQYANILPANKIIEAFNLSNSEVAIYPDKGAMERYSKHLGFTEVHADKVRNQLTGAIEGIVVNDIEAVRGKNVLIIDDICDGAKTFIELAKSLNGVVKDISLYVSHGIFSKGLDVIHDAGISKIFTKNGLHSARPVL